MMTIIESEHSNEEASEKTLASQQGLVLPPIDSRVTSLKSTDNTVLVRLPCRVYSKFMMGYKTRTSLFSEANFRHLLESIFPECNDLDSYKLKQKYYRLAEMDFHCAKTVLGREGTLSEYVSVVISGTVDVYRMIKKNSEVRSYSETVPT